LPPPAFSFPPPSSRPPSLPPLLPPSLSPSSSIPPPSGVGAAVSAADGAGLVEPAGGRSRAGLPQEAGHPYQHLQRALARRQPAVPGPRVRGRARGAGSPRHLPRDARGRPAVRVGLDGGAVVEPWRNGAEAAHHEARRAPVRDHEEEQPRGLRCHVRTRRAGGLLRGLPGPRGPRRQRPGPAPGPDPARGPGLLRGDHVAGHRRGPHHPGLARDRQVREGRLATGPTCGHEPRVANVDVVAVRQRGRGRRGRGTPGPCRPPALKPCAPCHRFKAAAPHWF
ncbi:unnamed protein product, partial [Prorocentrum cordatum]